MNPLDLTQVRTIPLQQRENKVAVDRFAQPPRPGRKVSEFLASLPSILAGNDLRTVVEAVVAARRNNRPVILGLGAHVIKCGLNPVIIDLMRRGIVTMLAMNGAGAIHDSELALIGETSEDVAAGLRDGTFGMVRETGEMINRAVSRVHQQRDAGMGALIADELLALNAPNREISLLANARSLSIPMTIHVAIGTDIVHMHPSADGAALGMASFNDFRIFSAAVCQLSGGVYINAGSAVLLPEVFLKAFTLAQNLGSQLRDFLTVNLDMMAHYRSGENVVRRPPLVGGRGVNLIGRHEIMIPLLAQAVVDAISADAESNSARVESHPSVASERSKVTDWKTLLPLRERYRAAGKSVVWTNGCFDLLHAGHLASLRAARALGDVLIVGVNGDESVRHLKGPTRPIVSEGERAELLAGLECVDHVLVFHEDTPDVSLSKLKPDIHCKGAEYAPPHGKPIGEAGVVAAYGGRVAFLPMLPNVSTTDLVARVQQRFSAEPRP